jgi:hypothetical protein
MRWRDEHKLELVVTKIKVADFQNKPYLHYNITDAIFKSRKLFEHGYELVVTRVLPSLKSVLSYW